MYEHCVDEGGHARLESLAGSTSESGLSSMNIPAVSLGDHSSCWNTHLLASESSIWTNDGFQIAVTMVTIEPQVVCSICQSSCPSVQGATSKKLEFVTPRPLP